MDSLIVALDAPNIVEAGKIVSALGESVSYYKVGMELFYGAGREAIDFLKERRKKIFLDLKLHDIPNTVGKSIEVLTGLGANMINVHASGGREMMKQAASSAKRAAEKTDGKAPAMIAVTILTSVDDAQWRELNGAVSIGEQVLTLAILAQDSGMDGVVASPMEAAAIRKACGDDFLIITPGIRRPEDCKNDQSRAATPKSAIEAGASHIVVGRPITAAGNPKEAAEKILSEIKEANA
ncbi:MAG: orotidine-5'-phosphate decarboxylase [Holosporaceae bacterium]|jgi:orotidine-5'-phosphate decarboxylase|nr:orotidine-5'-phosphate decarboxylase [Holosporaceae bacterium]